MTDWWQLATNRTIVRRAVLIAVIVGLILTAINHGDVILAGAMTTRHWFKVALTFFVPYCVSTVSSVAAMRERTR